MFLRGAPDDAALRVMQLAQPSPPLPNTEDDVDILQVTRTWLFVVSDARGTSRPVPSRVAEVP